MRRWENGGCERGLCVLEIAPTGNLKPEPKPARQSPKPETRAMWLGEDGGSVEKMVGPKFDTTRAGGVDKSPRHRPPAEPNPEIRLPNPAPKSETRNAPEPETLNQEPGTRNPTPEARIPGPLTPNPKL